MPDRDKKLKYGEYKARIEVKDSIGTPQSLFTTWRGDLIEDILKNAGVHWFSRGNTVIMEIIPANKNFTDDLFTEI